MYAETEREQSTHKVEVVPVRLEKHPNADKLSLVKVFGYVVATGTEDWLARPATFVEGSAESCWLGAYVPPDSTVPTDRVEFAFLKDQAKADGRYRVKAKKLRGVVSYGLLVPAPEGARLGDDVAARLGVEHYQPPLQEDGRTKKFALGGSDAAAPGAHAVKYDVDSLQRHHDCLVPGEPVLVTEKMDGSNARYVYSGGRMHCGSREHWVREYPCYDHLTVEGLVGAGMEEAKARERLDRLKAQPQKKNLFWYALERTPALRAFCEAHPDVVVYGEVFGRQGHLKYTGDPDEVFFAGFDVMRGGRWVDAMEARMLLYNAGVPCVPTLNRVHPPAENGLVDFPLTESMPYDFDAVMRLAEGPSLWPDTNAIREGVVVKPLRERWHPRCGRVCLKVVSAAYSERYR